MSGDGCRHVESRDTSPEGVARRAKFDASLDLLQAVGLPPHVIEHYRVLARETHKLPHDRLDIWRNLADESVPQSGA